MNRLCEKDKRLLELTALEVPWSMVCDEFETDFESIDTLAERVVKFVEANLIAITGPHKAPTARDLATEANTKGGAAGDDLWFSDWQLVTTAQGMRRIRDRLRRQ